MKRIAVFCAAILLSLKALAFAPLSHFGASQAQFEYLPFHFKVISWNIYKGAKKGLAQDFATIAQNSDVVLFQEAYQKPELVEDLTTANQELAWTIAHSFKQNGFYTGVATGSRVQAIKTVGFHSIVREPLLNTPKAMLLTEYAISNSPLTLLALNVHGINFVLNSDYEKQVQQIVDIIRDHHGPLLVAGDFNTWNSGRKSYLDKSLKALGVQQVLLKNQKSLDLAYVRNLSVTEGVVIESIRSSDHKPVVMQIDTSSLSTALAHGF